MILAEVCKDLQEIQVILAGLLKYDSVHHNTRPSRKAKILTDLNEKVVTPARSTKNDGRPQRLAPDRSKTLGTTLQDHELLEKRQYYRQRFTEFIMHGIRDKYSRQMNMFYNGQERPLGKNISKGASVDMNRDPKDYGIQARTHLLKVASLMIKHKVHLTTETFYDLASLQKRPS